MFWSQIAEFYQLSVHDGINEHIFHDGNTKDTSCSVSIRD